MNKGAKFKKKLILKWMPLCLMEEDEHILLPVLPIIASSN